MRKSEEHRELFNSVVFKSITHENFRVHLDEEKKGVLTVHIEARNSKKQWRFCIGEEGASINGIPTDGIFRALKDALRTASLEDKIETDTAIDFMNYDEEDAYIALKISIFGSTIGFEFKVEVIPLRDADVLRAQLVDAQEDILTLKATIGNIRKAQKEIGPLQKRIEALEVSTAGHFISLQVKGNVATIGIVKWPTVVHHETSTKIFSVAKDNNSITVNQPGVYQIHIRLGITNAVNGYATSLQLNGVTVAQSMYADAYGYQNTVQITETMTLKAKDTLQVTSNVAAIVTALNSAFMVLKLA
eukprot:gene24352-31692_t